MRIRCKFHEHEYEKSMSPLLKFSRGWPICCTRGFTASHTGFAYPRAIDLGKEIIMNKVNGLIGNNGYTNSVNDAKNGVRPASSGATSAPDSEDTSVSLSAEATGMQQLTQQLAGSPSFDQAKVDRIKALMAQGQYVIDPAKIAARFHELESQ